VLAALRGGGLVIYLRHTRTDWDQNARELEWVDELLATRDEGLFGQCDRQRLLNDEGRADARRIGDAIRGLGIPIGRVLTSAWCRTRETADLAFGGGEVAADRLWDTGYLPTDERKHYRDVLKGMLGQSPGGGTNTVLVGHMPQLADAAGVSLSEGEAAIVRPQGGSFKVVARVGVDAWDRLATMRMP
jgi:phosphohistidine phosphatase SixA